MGTKPSPSPPRLPARSFFFGRLVPLDAALSLHLYRLASPIPRSILLLLELSGDGRFFFPAVLSLLLLPLSPSSAATRRPLLAALLLGGLLDLLLVGLSKHLVRRSRPSYNSGMHLAFAVDHWSFPSGHSSRVFLVTSFLSLSSDLVVAAFCGPAGPADLAGPIVCAWAVVTSASRVLLGRHFVLDVVAGACLGVLEAALFYSSLLAKARMHGIFLRSSLSSLPTSSQTSQRSSKPEPPPRTTAASPTSAQVHIVYNLSMAGSVIPPAAQSLDLSSLLLQRWNLFSCSGRVRHRRHPCSPLTLFVFSQLNFISWQPSMENT